MVAINPSKLLKTIQQTYFWSQVQKFKIESDPYLFQLYVSVNHPEGLFLKFHLSNNPGLNDLKKKKSKKPTEKEAAWNEKFVIKKHKIKISAYF